MFRFPLFEVSSSTCFAHADAARTVFADVNILARQLMAILAMCAEWVCSPNVFEAGDDFQVQRIAAISHAAEMVERHVERDRGYKGLENNAMRVTRSRFHFIGKAHVDFTVPSGRACAHPQPTVLRLLHSLHHALCKVFGSHNWRVTHVRNHSRNGIKTIKRRSP